MPFNLEPGSAIQCIINGHRHGWNGSICTGAAIWSCGAPKEFREDNCSRGNPKCFHLQAFDAWGAHITIDDKVAGWALEGEPKAFDDQLMLFSGKPFSEPRGIREGIAGEPILYGVYRVQRVEKREAGHTWLLWDVYPYPDGWIRLDMLRVRAPYARKIDGPYLKEVERNGVTRVFRDAVERANGLSDTEFTSDQRSRLRQFSASLEEWMDLAAAKRRAAMPATPTVIGLGRRSGSAPLATLGDIMGTIKLSARPEVATVPKAEDVLPKAEKAVAAEPELSPAPVLDIPVLPEVTELENLPESVTPESDPAAAIVLPFIERNAEEIVTRLYGARALQQIRVGSMTKTLLVLVGTPGVGKSRLATRLVDDPQRERTCLVAVSSTWRGPEDLLGYVNPISGDFEPTDFTNFLRRADEAWCDGDRRPRLVVFEEFNLSPPEYWLSEILVRSQYDPEGRDDRTITLGGSRVRGWGADQPARVVLSPNVHFVATVNSDHTTRSFSPRVLDRAALVELRITPKAALEHAGVDLEEAQLQAIEDLDYCLESTGNGFSLRTAVSLQRCQQALEQLGISLWEAIDIVLLQEVLSKVRLLVGDPASTLLLQGLRKWTDAHGRNLVSCTSLVADWEERIEEGRDVIQA